MHRIPSIESRLSPEFLVHLDQENRRNLFAELDEMTLAWISPDMPREPGEGLVILLTLKFSILENVNRLVILSSEMTQKDISYGQLQSVHEEFLIVFQHILERKELIRSIMLKTHE